jgi:hypothetical protein
VNVLGEQLFAGAALAGDEHGRVGGRDLQRLGHGLPHRLGYSENLRGAPLHQDSLAFRWRRDLAGAEQGERGPSHEHEQLRRGEWLWQVVPSPGLHSAHAAFGRRVAGHHDRQRIGVSFSHFRENVETVNIGHVLIDQNDVEFLGTYPPQGLFGPALELHVVPLGPQHRLTTLEDARLVIYDEKSNRSKHFGVQGQGVSIRIPSAVHRLRFFENFLFQLVNLAHFASRLPDAF